MFRVLVDTIRELEKRGLTYRFLSKQSSFIPSGREFVAVDQYENDWTTREVGSGQYTYGKIFWIDSDIIWEPSQFMQILDSDEELFLDSMPAPQKELWRAVCFTRSSRVSFL
jgi:hypothetical protein